MVQTPFYSRDTWQPGAQDGRFGLPMRPASLHGRDLAVGQALRDCAGIPVKEFALFAVLENGQQKLYASSQEVQNQVDTKQVWNELHRAAARAEDARSFSSMGHEGMWSANEPDSEASFEDRKYSSGDNRRRRHPQRQSRSEESDDFGGSRKKRSRPTASRRGGSDDAALSVITSTKTQQLQIGDGEEVLKFYLGRFKDMQQNACKIMGKAFVKLVEPKKQTHHPYTKGDENAPDWWPPSDGSGGPVRHKEPDHLLKAERVCLLAWVVKLVVLPNDQQLDCIKHLNLNVKKLEDTTMEAMNNWFNDKEHPENGDKKVYLKEIFKIARQEERYKAGQIDGTTYCNVMFGGGPYVDDSSEDEQETLKDEAEERDMAAKHSTSIVPSDEMISPLMPHLKVDADSTSGFPNANRRAPPVRYASQSHLEDQEVSYGDASMYPRGIGIGFRNPGHNDSNRRYGPPVFQNTQQLYSTWNSPNNGMVSSASPTAYYTTSPQSSTGPSPGQYHLPALATPVAQQSMLPPLSGNHFESNPRPQYDMGPALGSQLRTGSLGHPHVTHHTFPDYMTIQNGYGQPGNEDPHPLHHPEQQR